MSEHLACRTERRRDEVAASGSWNGIDFLEVADDQRSLLVWFFGGRPEGLEPRHFRIDGGRRITGIVVTAVSAGPADDTRGADCLNLALDRYGDFSTYTLRLVGDDGVSPPAGFDPRYAAIDFSFKIDCPGDVDCAASADCPEPPRATPDIDYLAKDYAGFRQLLFDRLATTLPDWRERHVPDIGVTLVELLAHAADQLSAYQDAVATEAYLDTARTRISVRRHARLVDYRLHEGCNARAWLALTCTSDTELPVDAYFVTAHDDIAAVASTGTCRETDIALVATHEYEVFEQAPLLSVPTRLVAAHSELDFYTWGDTECCLTRGATRATLVDPAPPNAYDDTPPETSGRLKAGDVLIFEEVRGAETGNPADADPSHRQAVRLTRVDYRRDEPRGKAIIDIEWDAADALRFALCVSARLAAPDCGRIDGISVARGNVILVDHGRWIRGEALGCVTPASTQLPCGCDGTVPESIARPATFLPSLREAPLVHALAPTASGPAHNALTQDPRLALPQIEIKGGGARWLPRADLLDSDGDARHVVVETDDDGRAHLRFGDGRYGRAPTPGACFVADYRIGDPRAGNVPRGAIATIVFRASVVDASLAARNPLPAQGGTAAETLAAAKQTAPRAFRTKLARAITAEDYAQLAQDDPAVQRANARLVWTGSWFEADVAIDPYGTEEASPALCERIARYLECFRRAGHDLHVRPARYVPLAVKLHVCVEPGHLTAHVAAAVRAALVGRRGDGRRALFHPDALSFGDDIQAADIVAAVHAIDGVQLVTVLDLRRLDQAPTLEAPSKVDLAAWEIAQLDDDPNFPEHGVLVLQTGGGR